MKEKLKFLTPPMIRKNAKRWMCFLLVFLASACQQKTGERIKDRGSSGISGTPGTPSEAKPPAPSGIHFVIPAKDTYLLVLSSAMYPTLPPTKPDQYELVEDEMKRINQGTYRLVLFRDKYNPPPDAPVVPERVDLMVREERMCTCRVAGKPARFGWFHEGSEKGPDEKLLVPEKQMSYDESHWARSLSFTGVMLEDCDRAKIQKRFENEPFAFFLWARSASSAKSEFLKNTPRLTESLKKQIEEEVQKMPENGWFKEHSKNDPENVAGCGIGVLDYAGLNLWFVVASIGCAEGGDSSNRLYVWAMENENRKTLIFQQKDVALDVVGDLDGDQNVEFVMHHPEVTIREYMVFRLKNSTFNKIASLRMPIVMD